MVTSVKVALEVAIIKVDFIAKMAYFIIVAKILYLIRLPLNLELECLKDKEVASIT